MPKEDLVEVRFRLYDGTDIGPFRYSPASTIDVLKERVVSEWPKGLFDLLDKKQIVKLISGGMILENNKTVDQCKTPFGELPN
ncbi:membrane-anchored ubiquitin-fold protein 3 [Phtheirospermum japonicum]|uniref:Membrane-anchored ubiquitin-fold protein 3 n=1 Tax=Phtheirospermum japonicum TaxID=374723 RepID=A0A830CEH8_9LAMI|nr:membrane-anchored ubiquitin-fold protein 3 [Phtheirospermum japonicum]